MTAPDHVNARRFELFGTLLSLFPAGRLVDLGAGHGLFALAAADAGWDVTAVDARGDRYPVDDRVTWVTQDVRETATADFDLVACLGLWYHLTADDQVQLLERAAGTPIILDTHVANGKVARAELSDLVEQRGYTGRLYTEPDQATHSPASWGNAQSFWPRARDLYAMLADHGYSVLTSQPFYQPDRTFFLCLPR